jgi:hypothetical protein
MSNENTPEPQPDPLYDRLMETLAILDCVLGVLDQESVDAPRSSHLGSASLVLRRCIETLYGIGGDVEIQERLVEKLREVAKPC